MNELEAHSELIPGPETGTGLKRVGFAGSAIWLGLILIYSVLARTEFGQLKPNEIGDFLAGVFAPLAFFWLVLGFFQQGSELRNSGRALWLQGEELRNSVEQQRQLVSVTREQLEFESNRLTRELNRSRLLAQPRLELRPGGWGGAAGGRDQSFSLVNHGRPCTRLRVRFTNNWSDRSQDHLDTGSSFAIKEYLPENFDVIDVLVSYLDQHGEPGEARFSIIGPINQMSVKVAASNDSEGLPEFREAGAPEREPS